MFSLSELDFADKKGVAFLFEDANQISCFLFVMYKTVAGKRKEKLFM